MVLIAHRHCLSLYCTRLLSLILLLIEELVMNLSKKLKAEAWGLNNMVCGMVEKPSILLYPR